MEPTTEHLTALEAVRSGEPVRYVPVVHDGTPAPYTAVASSPEERIYALTVEEDQGCLAVILRPVGFRQWDVSGVASQDPADTGWVDSAPIYAEAQDLAWELQAILAGTACDPELEALR